MAREATAGQYQLASAGAPNRPPTRPSSLCPAYSEPRIEILTSPSAATA